MNQITVICPKCFCVNTNELPVLVKNEPAHLICYRCKGVTVTMEDVQDD